MAVAAESAETTTPAANTGLTDRAKAERKFAYILCAPAVLVMALVAGFPIVYAFWLSLRREDLRFPDAGEFIGFSNYATVLQLEHVVERVQHHDDHHGRLGGARARPRHADRAGDVPGDLRPDRHPRLRARAVRRGHRRRRVRVASGVRSGDRVRDPAVRTSTRRR